MREKEMKCYVYSADEHFGGSKYNADKIKMAFSYFFFMPSFLLSMSRNNCMSSPR